MKVYALPAELPAPEPDYSNYDFAAETAREQEHSAKLKVWLQQNGWNGPLTGEILYEPMGDGHAQYMYGDVKGAKACLIHLPYGDAWQSPNVPHLPKAEVERRIKRDMARPKLSALFG